MMTLNHGFSGYVCARAAMPLLARRAPLPRGVLALAFFLGAMLPDLDVLSTLLGPGHYFSGAWYAHRQASHSLLGSGLLALAGAVAMTGPIARREELAWPRAFPWLWGCLWAGGLLHIVGDLFTPRMPMPVFWPWPERFGALSHIGWFSPYLFWMFVAALGLERFARLVTGWVIPLRAWREPIVWAVPVAAAARWVEYLTHSRFESAAQWAAYQRALLPEILVGPVSAGVRAAWYWMVR